MPLTPRANAHHPSGHESPSMRLPAVLCLLLLLAVLGGCSHFDSPEALARRTVQADVFPTIQYAASDFYYRSPPQFPPRYTEQDTVYAGQAVYLIVTARNYAIAPDGAVDLTYALNIVDPAGTVHEGPLNIPLYRGRVPTPGLQLFPQDMIIFYTGSEDPVGEYTLLLTVSDNVSGAQRKLKQRVQVRPYQVPPPLPYDWSPVVWLENYYRSPTPGLALPALQWFDSVGEPQPRPPANTAANPYTNAAERLAGFYNQILTDNPWLLPHFIARYEQAKADGVSNPHPTQQTQQRLKQILVLHSRQYSERPDEIPPHLWRELRSANRLTRNERDSLQSAAERERLWGQFFASGSFAPIYALAATSNQHRFLDADAERAKERFERIYRRDGNEQRALTDVVPSLHPNTQALVYSLWSLHRQGQSHDLVRAYLGHITGSSNSSTAFDARALQLLGSVGDREALIAHGLPPINTEDAADYEALRTERVRLLSAKAR